MLRNITLALVAGLVLASAPAAFADEEIDTYLRNSGNPVFMNGTAFKDPSVGAARASVRSGGYAEKTWQDNASRPE